MRVKLDENLPSIVSHTSDKVDIHTAVSENLGGKNDAELWQACVKEQRLLITQDLDFSDLRQFLPGTHPGIVLVRLKNPSRSQLEI